MCRPRGRTRENRRSFKDRRADISRGPVVDSLYGRVRQATNPYQNGRTIAIVRSGSRPFEASRATVRVRAGGSRPDRGRIGRLKGAIDSAWLSPLAAIFLKNPFLELSHRTLYWSHVRTRRACEFASLALLTDAQSQIERRRR